MAKAPKVGEPIPLDVIQSTSPVSDDTVLVVGGQSDTVDDVRGFATSILDSGDSMGDKAEIVEEQAESSTHASSEQGDRVTEVNPLSVVSVLPLELWAAVVGSSIRTLHTLLTTDYWIGRQV
jgi:hypothetical protein